MSSSEEKEQEKREDESESEEEDEDEKMISKRPFAKRKKITHVVSTAYSKKLEDALKEFISEDNRGYEMTMKRRGDRLFFTGERTEFGIENGYPVFDAKLLSIFIRYVNDMMDIQKIFGKESKENMRPCVFAYDVTPWSEGDDRLLDVIKGNGLSMYYGSKIFYVTDKVSDDLRMMKTLDDRGLTTLSLEDHKIGIERDLDECELIGTFKQEPLCFQTPIGYMISKNSEDELFGKTLFQEASSFFDDMEGILYDLVLLGHKNEKGVYDTLIIHPGESGYEY